MAQKRYLDNQGLATLWSIIKTYVANAIANGVTDVAYDGNNKKLTKTVNGVVSDIVTLSTIKTDLALDNVDNTADIDKPISTATQTALDAKADIVTGAISGNFVSFDASGNLADSGSKASDFKTKQAAVADPTASGDADAFIDTISQDANGVITVTKKRIADAVASTSGVGGSHGLMTAEDKEKLSNITAGATKVEASNTNGNIKINDVETTVYTLPNTVVQTENGLIPAAFLPSYVDDVIEVYPAADGTELAVNWLSTTAGGSPFTPETGKIYVLMTDSTSYAANSQFRWAGSTYVAMTDGSGFSALTDAEITAICI